MGLKGDRGVTQFQLRWHAGLRKQIVASAARNHRSINAEILVRLERDVAREAADDKGAAA